jgi:signal transduction histidine kinase
LSPPRLPLYAQFLGWLALNLVLLLGLLIGFAGRDGLGLEMLLTDAARERAQAVGYAVSRQLERTPDTQWTGELADFGGRYGARFTLERQQARDRPRRPDFGPGARPRPGERFEGPGARREPQPPHNGAFVRLALIDDEYQLRIPLALPSTATEERRELAVTTGSLWSLLRFLGLSEWLGLLAGALLLCALWWWPFFYGITRRIGRLTRITERIAEGSLTERAEPGRPDELGRLAGSVNRMGAQLHAQVEGQRQFLLDVAHELTSPLARMQVGLAIVQDELPEVDARRLTPVLGDAQQMSELLQDLLQFSRSERGVETPRLQPVQLKGLVGDICALEAAQASVEIDVPPDLAVLADEALLGRGLANLVRNAVRHGGGSRIEIWARAAAGQATVIVADRGPGVPEAALAHLGKPFYRPDVARDRGTGGVGLGLALVRRCIERCGGQLRLGNRAGGGFEARVELPVAG